MRRLYTYCLALTLTLSVFAASAGMPLFAHICSMGCKKQVSLVATGGCCKRDLAADKAEGIKKAPCCDDQAFFLKKDLPGRSIVKINIPFIPQIGIQWITARPSVASFSKSGFQNHSPPILASRQRLSLLHILRA